MNRKPLKYEELVKLIEEGLSDIESLSDEDDECEIDSCEQRGKFQIIVNCVDL